MPKQFRNNSKIKLKTKKQHYWLWKLSNILPKVKKLALKKISDLPGPLGPRPTLAGPSPQGLLAQPPAGPSPRQTLQAFATATFVGPAPGGVWPHQARPLRGRGLAGPTLAPGEHCLYGSNAKSPHWILGLPVFLKQIFYLKSQYPGCQIGAMVNWSRIARMLTEG